VSCLDLSFNNLVHEHVTSMAPHLAHFSSLVEIDVSNNPQLGDTGLAAFLFAFTGMLIWHSQFENVSNIFFCSLCLTAFLQKVRGDSLFLLI
jgi:hypothetical protein